MIFFTQEASLVDSLIFKGVYRINLGWGGGEIFSKRKIFLPPPLGAIFHVNSDVLKICLFNIYSTENGYSMFKEAANKWHKKSTLY